MAMRKILIKDEIFKCEYLFLFNCSKEEANKHLKRVGNKELINEKDELADACLVKCNYGVYRICWIEKLNKTKQCLALLAHEIFHLVIEVCEDKGIPNVPIIYTGHCGNETGAYLMEFIYKKVLEKL